MLFPESRALSYINHVTLSDAMIEEVSLIFSAGRQLVFTGGQNYWYSK